MIFLRYMADLIQDGGRTEFRPWMAANARAAWDNRRKSDGIMGFDWGRPAPPGGIECQSAAGGVAAVCRLPSIIYGR